MSTEESGPVTTTDEGDAPAAKCPVMMHSHAATGSMANAHWWPEQLNLRPLNKNSPKIDPLAPDFDYAAEFATLDLAAVKADLAEVMTNSQEWWPADFGHYGGFFVRMTWHAAGTYRTWDGRGGASNGTQRYAPLNSWPDNVNLDKARRLLWPVKAKYGQKLSWSDLLILAGNVALETMGFQTFGFGGGRPDVWEAEEDLYWGPEDEWLDDLRYSGDRELLEPLGAVQMGLIYVNPEGPNGNPDPLAAARDIRETFARMAMDDEETVALIAGGHTFGKTHGAGDAAVHVGREPEAAAVEDQGLGWKSTYGSGKGGDAISSGMEGIWHSRPIEWCNGFFETLFKYEWEQFKSPSGGTQWRPTDRSADQDVPDPFDAGVRHHPTMLTTDLSLRVDPAYEAISRRFLEDLDAFADAFARAWFKLTHRDMGPKSRYLGPEVPAEDLIWQDPLPAVDHPLVGDAEVASLKEQILASGLTVAQLVSTAWASASTFRDSDMRGGANGARIRLTPQNGWDVNAGSAEVISVLEGIQGEFNSSHVGGPQVSVADLIVLGGAAAIEKAAADGGTPVTVPFTPGRTDATAEQTDADSFDVLEPRADGFRNYTRPGDKRRAEELLVDRSSLLGLTAPEMTVLVGGLRVLGANHGGSAAGVLTDRVGVLSTDFFTNLLDMGTEWKVGTAEGTYEGRARSGGDLRWTATSVDLVFGSNSQLRALAEVYASSDATQKFADDFVAAWHKVMDADRFDV